MAKMIIDDTIKKPNAKSDYTDDKKFNELMECATSPLYFMKNFMKIKHPTKGSMLFTPYGYQEKIIDAMYNHKNVIAMLSRQLGKTTVVAGFLLWKAMFTPDVTILIVANKLSQALEIMDRIRYAYENMPDYIRAGVKEYNKGSIAFDNSSRILSRATTADAGRGLAISLLYCDEFAFIPTNIAFDFWSAIRPVISTGGSTIITSTPRTDEDEFANIWRGAIDTTDEYGNEREDGVGKNGWKGIKAIWSDNPDRTEEWAEKERQSMPLNKFLQEHCCEFITDEETLVDSRTLNRLSQHTMEPEFFVGTTRWYQDPQPNKVYLAALDVSFGTGYDNAAIQVFQLPEMIQVAEWSHNKTDVKGQVKILKDILDFIKETLEDSEAQLGEPEIYWTVENNGVGESALTVIAHTGEDNFAGTFMSDPKRGLSRKGMFMSRSKANECIRMKSLIETDRLKINSKNLMRELKFFVASGNTFKAKPPEHDDLVMATLLIVKLLEAVMKWDDTITNDLREQIDDGIENYDENEPMAFVV